MTALGLRLQSESGGYPLPNKGAEKQECSYCFHYRPPSVLTDHRDDALNNTVPPWWPIHGSIQEVEAGG